MVFGTLATAIAAVLTYLIGLVYNGKAKPFLGAIPPIAVNAIVLPLIWLLFSSDAAYWLNMGTVAAGQAVAVLAVGMPLYYVLLFSHTLFNTWGLSFISGVLSRQL